MAICAADVDEETGLVDVVVSLDCRGECCHRGEIVSVLYAAFVYG